MEFPPGDSTNDEYKHKHRQSLSGNVKQADSQILEDCTVVAQLGQIPIQ